LVVFAELDPVPGRMVQAEDRAHRIGQKGMVVVHILVANHSLSARMAKICVKKQAVISKVLDVGGTAPRV
jgi:SWI/SNF-related matrix-associated actin-dependent regulator 1 of chromatin subfamily A